MHIEQWKKYFEKYRRAAISISVAIAFVIGSLGYCIWQIQSLRAQLYSRGGSLSREVSVSWAGKKWASYGDSITAYGGWQEYVTEYFGFAEHLNCGIDNTTFTYCDWEWYANADGSYNSRYDYQGVMEAPPGTTAHESYLASEDRISTQLPDDLDLVVIMGGSNDADYNISAPIGDLSYPLDETTFMGAVALTVIRVQRQCPDALVVLASPLSGRGPQVGDPEGVQQSYQTDGERNRLWLTTQDYAKAVKEVAEAFSIPYIDVFGSTGINPFNRSQYIADNVHPNDEGKKAIARLMIGMLDNLKPVERKP